MDIDDERPVLIVAPQPEEPTEKKRKKKKVKKMAVLETPTMLATGGGTGDGGFGGIGGGLLLGALLGRGLLGGEGRREDFVTTPTLTSALAGVTDALQNTTVMQTLGTIQGSIPLAEGQVQLALAGVNQSLQAQGFAAQLASLQGFTNVGDKVDSLSTLTAVGFGNTAAAIERNGWAVTSNANENTNRILAALNEQNIQNLQRQLTVAESALLFERSESSRREDRHGVEITMTNNQNQNQMQFQQQGQVLNALSNGLIEALQNIRSTNQAINIGAGTQTANPTNTNTNVKA